MDVPEYREYTYSPRPFTVVDKTRSPGATSSVPDPQFEPPHRA